MPSWQAAEPDVLCALEKRIIASLRRVAEDPHSEFWCHLQRQDYPDAFREGKCPSCTPLLTGFPLPRRDSRRAGSP